MKYLYEQQVTSGKLVEISPGVLWLTMPLPFELDHINLYLLRDDSGWIVVDTGLGTNVTRSLWEQVFDQLDGPISGVLVTHLHPDHVGLAGWIADKFDVPFYMSQTEYFSARAFGAGKNGAPNTRDVRYFHQAGLEASLVTQLTSGSDKGYSNVVSPIPVSYTRLKHGMVLTINQQTWQVIIGKGHSPEHVCLFNQDKKILISGDHILPMITPNIGAYSTEPEANTLKDYLDTLPQFKSLPDDVVVLPAHKLPFIGLHQRVDELIAHHQEHLKALTDACQQSQTVVSLLPVMFKRKLSHGNMVFAVAECLSHLNYLVSEGVITRHLNKNGVYEYTQR